MSKVVTFDTLTTQMVDHALDLVYEFDLHAVDATHLAACTNLACEAMLTDDEHLVGKDVKEHPKNAP